MGSFDITNTQYLYAVAPDDEKTCISVKVDEKYLQLKHEQEDIVFSTLTVIILIVTFVCIYKSERNRK